MFAVLKADGSYVGPYIREEEAQGDAAEGDSVISMTPQNGWAETYYLYPPEFATLAIMAVNNAYDSLEIQGGKRIYSPVKHPQIRNEDGEMVVNPVTPPEFGRAAPIQLMIQLARAYKAQEAVKQAQEEQAKAMDTLLEDPDKQIKF